MVSRMKPVIVITMGDAAGIGPEIIVKALQTEDIYNICRPLVVGDKTTMQNTIKLLKNPLKINVIDDITDIKGDYGYIDLLDLNNLTSAEIHTGQICKTCGRAAMEYITRATELTLAGKAQALVTTPINKEATKLAGYQDMGHLEYLVRLTGTTEYATMLVSGPLNVVHLTTHYSLKDACKLVTKERIIEKLKLIFNSFTKWGVSQPRIAVAGLNPHAGEGGLFGREEIEEIAPAIKEAQSIDINAHGPIPADSVFNRAINGEFDVVLALYHDQGHIPVKVYGFEKSISIALGLPFIRTSVDHGTAFDIAGKGIANAESMAEAIRTAVKLIETSR
ncbi:MAG: 4-hydroxythreonine-4-phosphate dehydrogenase PdxA [Dehalococcoidales bacterium]|nr:4-hydroxythreonine-4-phosphate dehydrogenase PdxA [Dehalococcoidales bacterium]